MIKVTLGNGEIKEFDAPLSAFDAARELGEAKTACAAEIDGKVCDLRTTLTDGCTVKFLTFEDEQGQRAFNHTASHVLAQAVKRLFPATKLAIGPAIENGFYYDFDTEEPFTTDTLAKIEAEMKKIVKESICICCSIKKFSATSIPFASHVAEGMLVYNKGLLCEYNKRSTLHKQNIGDEPQPIAFSFN